MKYALLIPYVHFCAFTAGYQAADGDWLRAGLTVAIGILTGWIIWIIFEAISTQCRHRQVIISGEHDQECYCSECGRSMRYSAQARNWIPS